MKIIAEYENVLKQVSGSPGDSILQERLSALSAKMDQAGAWDFESSARSILDRLKIFDTSACVKELSGGQQKRIALAQALIHPAGLLILDEPTNHIDLETIKWLEDYLAQYKSALLQNKVKLFIPIEFVKYFKLYCSWFIKVFRA